MVFKKPYAFLIKYFKILHLILAGLMIYLSVRINLITNLFNSLADNISVPLDGISAKYISGFMYFAIILILGISFIFWFLMKNKQKPTKYYLFTIGYYLGLSIFLMIYASALSSLEEVSMTNNTLRVYKDISFLLPIAQYYFILMAILRGIGFNIKQFNFSKDIKDLEISEEDSEEIEVNLSSNTYKYKRKIRKYFRELKYYFFENKYWILIILGIFLAIGTIYFFVNYKFVNNNFSQRSSVNVGVYNIFVKNAYITDKNLYGQIVNKDKKYVIIDMRLRNIFYESIELDIQKFILNIGGKYYYPITNKNNLFKDLGLPYDYKYLESNKEYNYILIYELDKKINTTNMTLKVYKNLDYEKNKASFANIKLKTKNLKNEIKEKKVDLNQEIVIDETKYNNKLNIKDYDIINKYEYNYEMCVEDVCSEKTGVIIPNDVLNKKLLKINYDLIVDKKSALYNFIKNGKSFFDTFVTLSYTYNGNKNSIKLNSITKNNVDNIIFIEVSKDIQKASDIELSINTRTNNYIYKLK